MRERIERFAADAGRMVGKAIKVVYLLGKLSVNGVLILWDVARLWIHRKEIGL